MRLGFYPKLALEGISKNRRLYFPYILTAVFMVMMEYIIMFLSVNEAVAKMSGGDLLSVFMSLGKFVIGLFALFFLFYSNSFLMKKRRKEFGLFNILGMGKRHIGIVVMWETLIVYLASTVIGCLLGIAFSKFAELGLLRLTKAEADLTFSIPLNVVGTVSVIFFIIFVLLLLNSLRQVGFSSAINLLRSENVGEKPPKANWAVGILGFVILGIAYFLAVSVSNAISAVAYFFVAVLLVIVATYLIMIFGSVVICRILKNNKNYYYKANHYVSVSSMLYRMRRNGAGLASICILSTMVLVMISTTSCLFFGEEDLLMTRNPRQININSIKVSCETSDEEITDYINGIVVEAGETPVNPIRYSSIDTYGAYKNDAVYLDPNSMGGVGNVSFDSVCEFLIITVDEYNRINNANETLSGNDCFVYSQDTKISNTINFVELNQEFKVVRELDKEPLVIGMLNSATVTRPIFLVVSNEGIVESLCDLKTDDGYGLADQFYTYFFDLAGGTDKEVEIAEKIAQNEGLNDFFRTCNIESRTISRDDFFSSFGGLFYLGIVLSIVFTLASVLIIYYKQISEGYEDQGRFEIMRKVGMTQQEIKKGINSQLLTVFFLPLVGAFMHIAFAFPMIRKLLALFNLKNTLFFATTTLISFVVFAVFYTIVYKITSNAYLKIVSSKLN